MSGRSMRCLRAVLPVIALALLVSGCSSAQTSAPVEVEAAAGTVVAMAPVGELAGAPTELAIGEAIEVLVDTPGIDWSVTSSAPEIVEVEGAGSNPGRVRLIAVAAGEADVVFDGGSSADDRISITVGAQ